MRYHRTAGSLHACRLICPVRAFSYFMRAGSLQRNSLDGAARSGTLTLQHGTFELPGALIYTRRGGALNLTPDVLSTLGTAGDQIYADASQLCVAPWRCQPEKVEHNQAPPVVRFALLIFFECCSAESPHLRLRLPRSIRKACVASWLGTPRWCWLLFGILFSAYSASGQQEQIRA